MKLGELVLVGGLIYLVKDKIESVFSNNTTAKNIKTGVEQYNQSQKDNYSLPSIKGLDQFYQKAKAKRKCVTVNIFLLVDEEENKAEYQTILGAMSSFPKFSQYLFVVPKHWKENEAIFKKFGLDKNKHKALIYCRSYENSTPSGFARIKVIGLSSLKTQVKKLAKFAHLYEESVKNPCGRRHIIRLLTS